MTKNLKDYLHYYLGCDVEFTRDGYTIPHPVELGLYNLGEYYNGKCVIKPILRPLNDLSDDELCEILKTGDHTNPQGRSPKEFVIGWKAFSPRTFFYLLSKGFDLFGLIESGQAINKDTMLNRDQKPERSATSKAEAHPEP